MIETSTAIVLYRSGNRFPPLIAVLFAKPVDQLFVILNFGHWNLFGIWDLVLGIF
jgi:hypothetical protein